MANEPDPHGGIVIAAIVVVIVCFAAVAGLVWL